MTVEVSTRIENINNYHSCINKSETGNDSSIPAPFSIVLSYILNTLTSTYFYGTFEKKPVLITISTFVRLRRRYQLHATIQ